jgi:hypothetical protein
MTALFLIWVVQQANLNVSFIDLTPLANFDVEAAVHATRAV